MLRFIRFSNEFRVSAKNASWVTWREVKGYSILCSHKALAAPASSALKGAALAVLIGSGAASQL